MGYNFGLKPRHVSQTNRKYFNYEIPPRSSFGMTSRIKLTDFFKFLLSIVAVFTILGVFTLTILN